jgi:signal transduction histidine kinase
MGTRGEGVFWLAEDGTKRRLSLQEGLASDNILALCVDQEGALWVGTDAGGLNRVRQPVFTVLELPQKSGARFVQSVSEDDQGGLWIGSRDGGVTYARGGMQQVFGPMEGLLMADIWCVFVDRQQEVWAGTGGAGLLKLQQGHFFPASGFDPLFHAVHALYQDTQGQLWAGTQGGLARWDGGQWRIFTTEDGLSANDIRALIDDGHGNLWIGTVGGGLNLRQNEQFTVWRKQDPDGLSSDDITSLHLDRDGVLWIGTLASGLNRFHQNQWTRYTTQVGLPSNHIGYMVEDDLDNLWIGSNTGLMRIRKQELEDFASRKSAFVACRVFGKPDGLPTRACTSGSQPGGCRAQDGTLWFPTAKGLASVNPRHLSRNPHPPPVTIESVLIDGQPQNTNRLKVRLPTLLVVPAGRERVEIHYNSLSLSEPNKSLYKYRLEKYESKWTEAGNSRVARYTRLPPGDYRFQVKAGNEDGVWNDEGCSLAIVVRPPLWRTGWFLGLAITAVLGSIVGGVHLVSTLRLQRQLERLRHQEALEKERSRIAQDIHDQLGASLTQVALLGELLEEDKDDSREVENHARQITHTARETTRTLDEIVWAVNPSNDTLDSLVNYLCKHAQDYLTVAGLRYRLDIPSDLPSISIPPEFRHHLYLAFKEAITNVVRHANAKSVTVRLHLAPGTFTLEVEDDGRGIAPMDEKAALARNGLRGMRKRVESVGGRLIIGPGMTGGTRVQITTPIQS